MSTYRKPLTLACAVVALGVFSLQASAQSCPEVFAWAPCPATSPITVGVHGGVDADTDATIGGLEVGVNDVVSGVGFLVNADYGVGSQSFFSDEFSGGPDDYRVIVLGVQARYPVAISNESGLMGSPIVGIKYYNWDYKDCPFSICEAETEAMVELGAGIMWGIVGLDAFTSLSGPDFSVRLRFMFGVG